ncbi:hypothetical protein AHAS_Ahas16G0212900 [Arachis hypogaea]
MVEKHSLGENSWIKKIHKSRRSWAHIYLQNKYFGHLQTTSQCEGINSMIKTYIKRKNTIIEFVSNVDLILCDYINNELVANFKTMHTEPENALLRSLLPTLTP